MSQHQFTDMVDFLDRFRRMTQQHEQESFDRFRDGFVRLRAGMGDLLEKAAEERRRTASTFNIFRLLGLADAEVRTHSALLADLLSPQGSHAQGTHFLAHFFHTVNQTYPELHMPSAPLHPHDWLIETEKVTSQGNLDMVLSSTRIGYLYVIENKIWATEQPEQLARYSQWLQQRQREYPHQALFYLTPDGRSSWTHEGETYFQLSYRDHITPWLKKAAEEVEPPRLVDVLTQYIEILEAFAGA